MGIALLLLRLTVGLTLAAHGTQKLFGWFGGPGLEGTGHSLASLGFHPGRCHALMSGLVETGGGVLLSIGLLTPLASALVLSVMFVAAISVHVRQGFFLTRGGCEYTLVLGVAGWTLAFTGPGALSVDVLLGWTFSGALWGFTALAVALAGSGIQLARRQIEPTDQAVAA